jgi:membrane-bound hydrogenase subunit beta
LGEAREAEEIRMKAMEAEELLKMLKAEFGEKISKAKIRRRKEGKNKREKVHLWLTIERDILKAIVKRIAELQYPHLSVISGWDAKDWVELLYHFQLNWGMPGKELSLTLKIKLPKDSLWIDSLCDLIPGAQITEREKQEMLGVKVRRIPDPRRFFLPDDFPEGIYPWRKDEKGVPEELIKKLWRRE